MSQDIAALLICIGMPFLAVMDAIFAIIYIDYKESKERETWLEYLKKEGL